MSNDDHDITGHMVTFWQGDKGIRRLETVGGVVPVLKVRISRKRKMDFAGI
jgi:hypothetical protein